jgi:hypothetical protein
VPFVIIGCQAVVVVVFALSAVSKLRSVADSAASARLSPSWVACRPGRPWQWRP